ncbi:MAG: leucine-rich repeat domain-containing protein [Clostridia bacterium]|nr:leucine-rich repeat domain-containing protein [Clostridia bacterium]
MKKLLITISMIAVFVCLFAISAFAASVEIDGIYYNLNGSGDSKYASVSNENATSCKLENVVIPESVTYGDATYPVTTIDYHAFSGTQGGWGKNQTVKSIVIPSSVTSIGSHFLRECKSVETVVIKAKKEGGITLSDAEFYNCTSLKTVDLSESDIVSFRQYTFYGCSSLTTVNYPKNLTNIGSQCFRLCTSFTSGDLTGTKVVTLGGGAFWDCKALTEIKFPDTLQSLGSNCLQETALKTIVFPHTLNKLDNDSIANNRQIYMMVLPEIATDNTSIHAGAIHDFFPKVVIYSGTEYEHLTS